MSSRQFAGYELMGRIASGGMAEIYLARRFGGMRFEKLVALKRMLPNLAEDPEYVKMFGDEARILAQLGHPNIVQVLDFGRAEGVLYMALEYLHGETLAALVARNRERGVMLAPAAVAYIGSTVARALHYAHEACDVEGQPLGILHRDVTPHNVLIGYAGAIKLIDFGVAQAAGRDTKTRAGVIKGKLSYMAPEQFSDGPVDRRADVFALGVLMWEMASGRRLFGRDSDALTIRAILEWSPPDLRDVAPWTPPELATLVTRMMAKVATARPATALEVARRIDEAAPRQVRFDDATLGELMVDRFAVERTRKEEMLKVAMAPTVDDFLFADRTNVGKAFECLTSSSPVTKVETHRRKQRRLVALGLGGLAITALGAVALLVVPRWQDAAGEASLAAKDAAVETTAQAVTAAPIAPAPVPEPEPLPAIEPAPEPPPVAAAPVNTAPGRTSAARARSGPAKSRPSAGGHFTPRSGTRP